MPKKPKRSRAADASDAPAREKVAQGKALEAAGDLEGALAAYSEANALFSGDDAEFEWEIASGLQRVAAGFDAITAALRAPEGTELVPGFADGPSVYEQIDRAAKRDPVARKARDAYLKASDAFDADDFERAIELYKLAVDHRPDFTDALYNLGVAHLLNREPAEALAVFRETLRVAPQHAPAASNGGVAAIQLERLDDAAALFRAALAIDEDHADARYNLAYVLIERGDFADALACADQLAPVNPEGAETIRAQVEQRRS